MWWWHDGGWFAWTLMTIGMVAFWVVVGWVLVMVVRRSGGVTVDGDPERKLANRFAAGEIDAEQYQAALDVLRGARR